MQEKILSIVVPYYKETQDEIFPLLSSLNNQVGVDYSVIECLLVNDGEDYEYSQDFLNLFSNLDIKTILMPENCGPGVARQTGLEHAKGEYIMFCDADDTLHNVAVLGAFLGEINQNHPDIITSAWLEEIADNGSYIYIPHDDEATWMHGKAFRRVFLQTKGIRFHDDLRIHEDSYFLALAFANTDNARKIPFTSYIWKYNDQSITRRNNALYSYESIPEFIRAIGLSFEALEKTVPGAMPYKVLQFVMYEYFQLHQESWLSADRESYLTATERAFIDMIQPYMDYFVNASPQAIGEIYTAQRAKSPVSFIETETLHQWLVKLGLIKMIDEK